MIGRWQVAERHETPFPSELKQSGDGPSRRRQRLGAQDITLLGVKTTGVSFLPTKVLMNRRGGGCSR